MNSTIASNINGTLASEKKDSLTQKIAIGSRSSLLNDNVNFTLTATKKPSSCSSIPGQFLCRLNITEPHMNGQKKVKNEVDQNRNPFSNNSYGTLNGNKDKVIEDGMPIPKVQLYTGKIQVEWQKKYKIGAGLHNINNTCFMNTVIQCLTYCPPLANYLMLDIDHSSKCNASKGSVNGFCMMCILQAHMRKAIDKEGDVIKPFDFYHRLKLIAKHFQHGRQEDAHEFLRYVIDNLWKSCLQQNNNSAKLDPASKETTVVNQIFGGYHRSQVTCLRCKEKSNTFDHFMDFILDIKQNVISLQKALERYIHPELLDQENSYKCPKCKIKVTAHKKFTVHKAPNVATFQLKRFDYNRSFGGKISKQISYPEKLNLRPYMSDPKGDPVWYHLNAVLVHSGSSCNSGHYYCYVRNSDKNWYIMDDSRVQQVRLNTVLDQIAYVLFYVKIETSQGPTFKKCFDNRDSTLKGPISAGTYKKFPEMPLKSSPLAERNQAKVSSPTVKSRMCLPVTVSKKLPLTPNASRDRITFGIRASMPTIQDIQKSADLLSPSKKAKSSHSTFETSNNHSGLVPYVKDSSESSDENESSRVENSKAGSTSGSSANLSEKARPKGDFKITKNVNDSSDKIEIKRKLSKQCAKLGKFSPIITNGTTKISPTLVNSFKSRPSFSNHSSSTPPKVIATGSWTVTDNPPSPSAGSTCSSNSVTSTSDWHVTSTNVDCPIETVVSTFGGNKIKENGNAAKTEGGSAPVSDLSIYSSPKQAAKNIPPSNSQENNETSSCGDLSDSMYSMSSSSKKSDFRKQRQTEPTFPEPKKRSHPKYAFLKRKFVKSVPKVFPGSPESKCDEIGHNSLSKKTKFSEECTESDSKNGFNLNPEGGKCVGSKNEISKQLEHSSLSKKSKYSEESAESPSKNAINVKIEKCMSSESESLKDKKKSRDTESSLDPLKYAWVEKTKDSNDSNHRSPVKEKNNYHSSSSNISLKMERKQDVVSELTKNSQYFYGASVPTWKGENHYKESPQSITEKRKSFDDYEDEYDRGKIRKSRPKDRYQHYYPHKNPFQQYGERAYHSKYNGNFNYGRHNHHNKPYDSHYKWKQNRNYDHNRHRNDFRPSFRR